MLTIILAFFWLPPEPAARLVDDQLVAVCQRESRCTRIGVHEVDAWAGRASWRNAVRVGWLDPEGCPFHALGEPSRWSTRGAFGLNAAYTLHHIGSCLPPEVLDLPIVSAIAAHRRAASEACDQHERCRRWRAY